MIARACSSRSTFLVWGLALLTACGDAGPTEVYPNLLDPYVQAIVALGFRPDMIVDRGDHFLVEGDIFIPKANLLRRPPERSDPLAPLFQWRTTNLVSAANVTHITVDLSALESSWQTAMRDAMVEWNTITAGAVMKFYEASPGEITATMDGTLPFANCFDGVIAVASWPGSAQPGPTIRVNPDFTDCQNAPQKKRNMAHELGHTIGFRHTNWQGNETAGPIGAWRICSTPQTDAASVMNGATGLVEWDGFSYEDKHAAFCLYPREPSWIAPTFSYPGYAVVSWDSLPDSPEYQLVMSSSGWQIHEGEQYGFGTNLYTSAWTSTPQITVTGFAFTGYVTCRDGDGSQEGDWYKQLDTWVNLRYADGFTDQKSLLSSPEVLDCPTGTP